MGSADAILRLRRRQTPAQRRAEILADVEPYLDMSPEQHDEMLQAVVRAAFQQLIDAPRDVEQEPPAEDFPAIWKRLHDRSR